MGADDRANVAQAYPLYAHGTDFVGHILAIGRAVAVAHEDHLLSRGYVAVFEVLYQAVQAGLAPAHLFHGHQMALVVHMQDGLDAQKGAGHRGGAGKPAPAL